MNGVAPANFRAKFDRSGDDADLAAEFVEQEVGHYDWRTNWPKFKARYPTTEALTQRVRAWLDDMHIDHEPSAVVAHIDRMVDGPAGKWR